MLGDGFCFVVCVLFYVCGFVFVVGVCGGGWFECVVIVFVVIVVGEVF